MKRLAKKIWLLFADELMEKMQSDKFETTLAKKIAEKVDLKDMTEEEEIAYFKKIADCCTDSVAVLMGGEAD
tara:strand:+ start:325 stop:540 length:216 start_codon:yes stop_codon:yes gene_type:complete